MRIRWRTTSRFAAPRRSENAPSYGEHGHLFQPQEDTDSFVSMVSPHVTPGRRNLAAHTIGLMRRVGMSAFQTPLFPLLKGDEIKRLHHLPRPDLDATQIDTRPEMGRAMAVCEPVWGLESHRIAYAANVSEVMANVWNWNGAMETAEGRKLWGRRTVTYFVYDPKGRSFAPSKYCAFMAIESGERAPVTGPMTMQLYTQLDESETRFDGHIAQRHLQSRLAMGALPSDQGPDLRERFSRWVGTHSGVVTAHPRGPVFMLKPNG